MISVCPSFDVISVLRSDHGDSVEVEKTARENRVWLCGHST